jgi:uncharacterized membrane protein YpjA
VGHAGGRVVGLFAVLQRFKTDWRLLAPLLLVNAAGMGFGWYYYADVGQFDLSNLTCGEGATTYCQPWWTWPLVSDSPNAVLLFFVTALAFKAKGWRSKWLDSGAFILNVYVGLWTTLLFLLYPDRMGTFDYASVVERGNANPILFIAHMGMPLQALVLVPDLRRDSWSLAATLAVVAGAALYIAVDYSSVAGDLLPRGILHPAPFLHPDDGALHAGSPWLMVAAVAAWWLTRPFKDRQPQGTTPP